jgi:hypothetical protein
MAEACEWFLKLTSLAVGTPLVVLIYSLRQSAAMGAARLQARSAQPMRLPGWQRQHGFCSATQSVVTLIDFSADLGALARQSGKATRPQPQVRGRGEARRGARGDERRRWRRLSNKPQDVIICQ